MNYEIQTTNLFDNWPEKLKDRQAAITIAMRLARVTNGHFGDTKIIVDGVSELRIVVGSGYLFISLFVTTQLLSYCVVATNLPSKEILKPPNN